MMSMQILEYVLLPPLLIHAVRAQTASYSVQSCAAGSPITAVPACDPFLQGKPICPRVGDEASQKACLCKQDVINVIRE